jgi:hypothetical protein
VSAAWDRGLDSAASNDDFLPSASVSPICHPSCFPFSSSLPKQNCRDIIRGTNSQRTDVLFSLLDEHAIESAFRDGSCHGLEREEPIPARTYLRSSAAPTAVENSKPFAPIHRALTVSQLRSEDLQAQSLLVQATSACVPLRLARFPTQLPQFQKAKVTSVAHRVAFQKESRSDGRPSSCSEFRHRA